MALLEAKLDGVWTDLPSPSPTNYYTTYEHIENSFRNARAYLKREIIRRNAAKIFCGWDLLKPDDIALLQSLYEYDSFELKFTDNYNNRVIKTVYAGPLTAKARTMNKATYEIALRTDIQMNFIEV
jgi:hypothetical protein